MIDRKTATRLGRIGLLVASPDRIPTKGPYWPFFVLSSESEVPSVSEEGSLPTLTAQYLEGRYSEREIKDGFWGLDANTIILNKRDGLWQWRRRSWEASSWWAPVSALSLRKLFGRLG